MQDYVIVGPRLQPDNGVLEAIYSLFYLPIHYQIILPFTPDADPQFRKKIDKIIEQNALQQRVHCIEERSPAASPEAFASAVLRSRQPAYE